MEKDNIIGANVRLARVKKGMTQVELAEKAGVALSTVSFVETGRHAASRALTLSKLANALGVSVESLLQA
jgi:transcriptional regulator with XRE-family HTH domain